jgi:glycosyltransferase involved in cell wall biosynthesis
MKKEPPSLVILTPGFPEDEDDTTCLPFLQSLVRTINRDYSSIRVIILSFQYPFSAKEYIWNGNPVISFGGRNRGKWYRRLVWIRVRKRLKQIRKDNNVVGLFAVWLGECAWVGSRFSKRSGLPFYCWIAGQDARAGNKYVRKMDPGPERLIAISDAIADEFFKNYLIRPLHIIPCGIEKELFTKTTFERTVDILAAGSLIPLKRYDWMVNSMRTLREYIPGIYAVIAGKGVESPLLLNRIKEMDLRDKVVLNGEMSHPDLLRLMQQSKIFLHPSSYEGFSMVCLEALYAGCQVISCCKPMNKDIKNWHIVATEIEMAEKAGEILLNAEMEYEQIIPFSIHETAASILKLFLH